MTTQRFFAWLAIIAIANFFTTIVDSHDCEPIVDSRDCEPIVDSRDCESIVKSHDCESIVESVDCEPEIITYGECPYGVGRHLQYGIQRPPPVIACPEPVKKPVIRKSYGYEIEDPLQSQQVSSTVGFELPVGIQRPIVAPCEEPKERRDPFRGKTYSFGIETTALKPEPKPILRQYNFGVQNSVSRPKPRPQKTIQYLGPYVVKVEETKETPSCLSGELPIEIEKPISSIRKSIPVRRPVQLLTGLKSRIDKILVPIDCEIVEKPDPCAIETTKIESSTQNDFCSC